MPSTLYTVRLTKDKTQQLSKTEFNALGTRLIRIKRSSGKIEYATKAVVEHLESNRKQRRNQRKLADMRNSSYSGKSKGLRTLIKQLLS